MRALLEFVRDSNVTIEFDLKPNGTIEIFAQRNDTGKDFTYSVTDLMIEHNTPTVSGLITRLKLGIEL